jgi:hypothetical protein
MAKEHNENARLAVIREYDVWARKNSEVAKGDPMNFFTYLQRERSDLLDFKSRGSDKWQVVHGWLLGAGRVNK